MTPTRTGRPRDFLAIDRLPLVGGRTCLDFINTTGARAGPAPRERLTCYADLLVFCRRAQIHTAGTAAAARRRSQDRPQEAAAALRDLIELRELLYRVLSRVVAGQAPAASDLGRFNKEHQLACQHRRLSWSRSGPAWARDVPPGDLAGMRWSLVESAADLLTSGDLARVRQCAECDWLFLDSSKNGSRLFCKKTCSDRVRSRRHYQRRQAAKRPRPRRRQ
jgi:predicted RNA-binding Zn ribbon-like protein